MQPLDTENDEMPSAEMEAKLGDSNNYYYKMAEEDEAKHKDQLRAQNKSKTLSRGRSHTCSHTYQDDKMESCTKCSTEPAYTRNLRRRPPRKSQN